MGRLGSSVFQYVSQSLEFRHDAPIEKNCATAYALLNFYWEMFDEKHEIWNKIHRVAAYIRRNIVCPLVLGRDSIRSSQWNIHTSDIVTIQYCNDELK